MTVTVAALYVQRGGIYWGRPYVDPWDEGRDARMYAGPYPVVAHPPCNRWCQLAPANEARYGHKVGDDGGTFAAALISVLSWGGVLEHPAFTHAWKAFGLQKPRPGSWQSDGFGGWVTQVSQVAYGCPARKRTWLYFAGPTKPVDLDWSEPEAPMQISHDGTRRNKPVLSGPKASATPPAFAEALLALARSAETC